MSRIGAALIVLVSSCTLACAREAWQTVRRIADFDRFDLVQPDVLYGVRKHSELKVAGTCVTGGAECDIEVPATGWYELLAEPEGGLNEYVIDGKLSLWAGEGRKANPQDRYGKVDNLWLTKGRHTIRVQRYIWWGFWPATRSILVRKSDGRIASTIRVEYAHGPGDAILRKGDSVALSVSTAGRAQPATLTAQLRDRQSGRVESGATVQLPAGENLQEISVKLPCNTEGIFEVRFLDGDTLIGTQDLKPMTVYVIDTTPVERKGGELQKTLLREIDCAGEEPDYVSGGATQVVSKPFGAYRLSGDSGCLYAQHHNVPASWFAYKIDTPEVGKPHLLEVDYPDDDYRTFLIVIRESSADDYPVAGGVDSGGCWSLSNQVQTQSILFWPKTANPRVAFAPPHNGRRAAAARIRVYRVDGQIPPLDVPVAGGRAFLNWYEEGSNFTGFYGGTKGGPDAYLKSADMWPRELCYMGGNLLIPTVSVYQMSLYPSRYNHHFAEMTSPDIVRLLLLNCEKYGVKLAAEFHPEARELEYPWVYPSRRFPTFGRVNGVAGPYPPEGLEAFGRGTRENGLVSKDGKVATYDTHGPMHHPLHPRNQEWYLGLIGELADLYKDSPAFAGVSLRAMSWANPALNNFHSLDWGYDDLTTWLFEKETGTDIAAPVLGPDRFAKRYDWLMKNARQKWIAWRCDKMAELHRKIVARVRQARNDLSVYVTVFDLGEEAGLDYGELSAIDGLVLINARHSYGRQAFTYEGFLADQAMRDKLLAPDVLHSLRRGSGQAAFLFGARYFEATEKVLKPIEMGLPAETKDKWISGVVNPAGRHYLERYAVALAETDALILGDGGNAYTLGQPLLREFTREFRHLPPVPFTPRKDARDPVAVWELAFGVPPSGGLPSRDGVFLFYAVNRERYPVRVAIALETKGPVRRLATGENVTQDGNQLKLDLQPYQLLAFQAPAGTKIAAVSTAIPDEDRAHVQAMVATLEKLAKDAAAGQVPLGAENRQLLSKTLDEAVQCLNEGRFWRARTLLENRRLTQEVYNPALVFPPGLEHLIDPRRMRALKARGLPRPKDPLLHIAFDQMEDGTIPVTGKLALQAKCEGACDLRDGRFGKALHLDGKTGKVVLRGDGAGGLNLKDFTLSVWVNTEPGGTDRKGILFRQKWPAGYALFLWNGSVAVEAGSKDGNVSCRTQDGLCQPGVWYHLAVAVESGKAITLYVDGEEAKKAEMKHPAGASDAPFLLGWNGWGGRQNDPSPGPFVGLIDELTIWDRVLSPDEVLAEAAGKR